jgi:Heterokaryon incompatibility protein (HET)
MNLPSRLIVLGFSESETQLKVCHVSSFRMVPAYLTLSHCWGGADVLRLTSDMAETFSRALPIEKLLRTFKEAITITQCLRYGYLWIDSRWIVQESAANWARESAIIGDIYRNSVCTVATLAANGSNRGCFTRKNSLLHRPCLLGEGQASGLYAFRYGDPNQHKEMGSSSARLITRA